MSRIAEPQAGEMCCFHSEWVIKYPIKSGKQNKVVDGIVVVKLFVVLSHKYTAKNLRDD